MVCCGTLPRRVCAAHDCAGVTRVTAAVRGLLQDAAGAVGSTWRGEEEDSGALHQAVAGPWQAAGF